MSQGNCIITISAVYAISVQEHNSQTADQEQGKHDIKTKTSSCLSEAFKI